MTKLTPAYVNCQQLTQKNRLIGLIRLKKMNSWLTFCLSPPKMWWTKPLALGLSPRPRRRLWDVLWSRRKSLGHYQELCSSTRSAPLPLLYLRSHGLLNGNQKTLAGKRQSKLMPGKQIPGIGRVGDFCRWPQRNKQLCPEASEPI